MGVSKCFSLLWHGVGKPGSTIFLFVSAPLSVFPFWYQRCWNFFPTAVATFHPSNTISNLKQLEGRRIYFYSRFQKFPFLGTWPCPSGPERRLNVEGEHRRTASWQNTAAHHGSWEAENKKKGKSGNNTNPSRARHQGPASSNQAPAPTFHCLPVTPESITGLIHCWGFSSAL
jgi:hypothetical protein